MRSISATSHRCRLTARSASTSIGGACLCGIGDTVALLLADEAFPPGELATVAKIGVLAGSVLAAVLGAAIVFLSSKGPARTEAA